MSTKHIRTVADLVRFGAGFRIDRWTMRERARTSFLAGRSGDFVVLLKRDITPIADTSRYIATHGSPWDYDRRVPIVFWRKGMSGLNRDQPTETIDIMPTLAAMVGLVVPAAEIDGKCLAGVPGAACPKRYICACKYLKFQHNPAV